MTRRWMPLLFVMALLAAACGGGSDGGGEDEASTSDEGETEASAGPADPVAEVELEEGLCPVGAHENAEGPIEVLVWHVAVAQPAEALQQVADRFNASQDQIVVRLENQGTDFEEVIDKYLQGISSGNLPTLAFLEDTSTVLMNDTRTIIPAQACFDADETVSIDDLTPIATEYYRLGGNLLPGSAMISTALTYYNATHFEEAGITEPPASLDDIRSAAEALVAAGVTSSDGEPVTAPFVLKLDPWIMEFFLTGNGNPIVDADNGRSGLATSSAFDNEGSRELLTWLSDMYADGLMQVVTDSTGALDHYLAMATQSASFSIEASGAATSIAAFVAGEDIGDTGGVDLPEGDAEEVASQLSIEAAPFPGIAPGGLSQMGGTAVYLSNGGTPETQAAGWEFIKFMNEPEQQETLLIVGSNLPFRPSTMEQPAVVEWIAEETDGAWLDIGWSQVEALDPEFPGPLMGPYTQVRNVVRSGIEDMILGGGTPDDAVASIDADITDALAEYADGLGG